VLSGGCGVPKSKRLDPAEYRDNPVAIARYLTDALEKNELGRALSAIESVLKAQNVQALSEVTGMRRENLYRMLRGESDPLFSRILRLLDGLNVCFEVRGLPSRDRPLPPRPKLGRPPKPSNELSKRDAARRRKRKIERIAAKAHPQ
jgi:probable addiction module antidote protein